MPATYTPLEMDELELLLEALYRFCDYDLRQYGRRSLMRLIQNVLAEHGLEHVSDLIPLVAHDLAFRRNVIDRLTVSYSVMFRDPELFKRLEEDVLLYLQSFPRLSIWIAGCADGEEVYSLAILLAEAGLLERTQLYATDISPGALGNARSGILQRPLDVDVLERYKASGGRGELREYFTPLNGQLRLNDNLLQRIAFEKHDLVQQPNHVSAHLILCRNVFIYFGHELKNRVLDKLADALVPGGFLAIGVEESISLCESYRRFDILSRKAGLFRKKLGC
ncbi:CheR family methyltransferase [Aliamphritea spongicola]|uniref:CheR family methyltransferase n=1 Tax=Aliamphritea spongicola TaxID=707589 RepID=UPI00196B875C|nr:CheR family methyltransferase [Aliamphritea spongicola]MBN3564125.1 protein-glutamate O-methyltransferase CheR [Aliamphritea spongicola]